ncbi:MAG: DinB family protein [Bacteroidota bacterium]
MYKLQLQQLRQTRQNVLRLIQPFSIEQLNKIPDQFNNNLIWNLGHIVVTQQLLCYRLAGQTPLIEDPLIDKYRKGSRPTGFTSSEELQFLQDKLFAFVDQTEADLAAGLLQNYRPYSTSFGLNLDSIEAAIHFNNIHEGLHLGVMMGMRKLV